MGNEKLVKAATAYILNGISEGESLASLKLGVMLNYGFGGKFTESVISYFDEKKRELNKKK